MNDELLKYGIEGIFIAVLLIAFGKFYKDSKELQQKHSNDIKEIQTQNSLAIKEIVTENHRVNNMQKDEFLHQLEKVFERQGEDRKEQRDVIKDFQKVMESNTRAVIEVTAAVGNIKNGK